jgi:pyruvate dehydrogenase E1 component
VYAAYQAAVEHVGSPTVILAKTIKGYGLGEAGEGRNISHQQKKLNEEELREFRSRFGIPISDDQIDAMPFYRPPEDSVEMKYVQQRRAALGGCLPDRRPQASPLKAPGLEAFAEFLQGSGGREVSTTMAYVRVLASLLRHPEIGRFIVPIVPDEARTFGMEALFKDFAIYSHVGQLYEPVDRSSLLYYHEAVTGQILEEGITEAGSLASWIAAGTAYATHGLNMIPFFTFYSMFGFQRVGDLIWAAADSRSKGFLMGATAGRTTLSGEGLQHQDGHSQLAALSVPNCVAYDPAFAYEIAVILQDGIRRMYAEREDIFYYLTLYNENYAMPPMPEGAAEGILRGMYRLPAAVEPGASLTHTVNLLGSGPILREALRAQQILAERCGVAATVWSVTSYKELRGDALGAERWNMLHPEQPPRRSYLEQVLEGVPGPFIAASDYMRALPEQIARWVPGGLLALGTDGFGRSETRGALRRHFEIDAEAIVVAALYALAQRGEIDRAQVRQAITELGVDPEQPAPWRV